MKYIIALSVSLILIACNTSKVNTAVNSNNLTKKVNTFLGTAPLLDPKIIGYTPPRDWRVWAGLTYPGSSLPNAMVQLSPITEYGTGAGYEYEDTVIHGFTHTNKGHWNLCNIPVMPVTGQPGKDGKYSSRFSHDRESAGPGHYNVFLETFSIDVKLTSTLRTGYHRYEYPTDTERYILFDLSRANNDVRNWQIEQAGDSAVSGFQEVHENKIYFYALTTAEIETLEITGDNKRQGHGLLKLKNDGNRIAELKIGLSFVSVENARQNLVAEIGNKSFNEVLTAANQTWEDLLSKIAITGGTEKQQWVFYSSLYRSFLWPALRSDVNGEYTDVQGNVIKAEFNYYTTPSLWDTYRNKLVLLGLVSPEVTSDVIRSMQDIGDKRGFLPTFFHGDHAAPFIAGSYRRGIKGYDVQRTYELLLKNANIESRSRPHLNEYLKKGYISDPHIEKPHVETKAKAGVSKTLEYAYDDYAVAQMAKALGDSANYRVLMQRAGNYKNVFDKSVNFMRGRLEDGTWIQNFNPQYPYYEYMYREANAWQLSFFAPHDIPGLIDLYGGSQQFEAKLDSLFTVPWDPNHIARNVSSFIGQYCHGNQPDHEAPFSYHFIGKPEKSQKIIDTILNHFYALGEQELALCGMDDAGEMSSWYVFAAIGLYPFSPADDEYIVSAPLFDKIEWKLNNGKILRIIKTGKGRKISQIKINGTLSKGYFASHNDLFTNGGEIEMVMD